MTDFELMDLYRKATLFGLSDLRRLAPIGDIGYLNGIDYYRGDTFRDFLRGKFLGWIYRAYRDQSKVMGFKETGWSTGWARTDHHTRCEELGLTYHVDSSG